MKEDKEKEMAKAWCDFQERMMMSNGGCGPMVLAAVLLVVVVLTFFGCTTTKYVPVIEHQTDTLRQYLSIHDSIYINDSTVIHDKGDTVTIDRWHTKYIKKEIHDTTYIATHDTIPEPYPVEVVKEVPADISWWQATKMHIGGVVLWLIGIAAVVWIGKFVIKRYLP